MHPCGRDFDEQTAGARRLDYTKRARGGEQGGGLKRRDEDDDTAISNG